MIIYSSYQRNYHSMKFLLTLAGLWVVLFSSSALFAQDTINRLDENLQKQGYWIIYGRDYPGKGFPDYGVIEEGYYVDNRKEGPWVKYFSDGKTPRYRVSYENGRPNGVYEKYYENGQLQETGRFEGGKNLDSTLLYYESGCIKQVKYHDDEGKDHGRIVTYYDNCSDDQTGQIQLEYMKDHGVTVDTLRRYYVEGYVKELFVYDRGEIIFSKKYELGESGDNLVTSRFEGELKEGSPWIGTKYYYDDDGEVIRTEEFNEGIIINTRDYQLE